MLRDITATLASNEATPRENAPIPRDTGAHEP